MQGTRWLLKTIIFSQQKALKEEKQPSSAADALSTYFKIKYAIRLRILCS